MRGSNPVGFSLRRIIFAMKQLTLSSLLPTRISDALRPAVLMVRNRSIPVFRLEGPARTGRAAVLIAGSSHTAELLTRRLFSGDVQTVQLATVPVWSLNSYLRKMADDVDFSVICVDKLSARLFFPSDCLRVPDAIDVGLKVPEEIATLWRSNHSLKQDIRQVHRRGMQMSLSQTEADFDLFYRTMRANALAKKWYRTDNLTFVVLGNASKIRDTVKKYAPPVRPARLQSGRLPEGRFPGPAGQRPPGSRVLFWDGCGRRSRYGLAGQNRAGLAGSPQTAERRWH